MRPRRWLREPKSTELYRLRADAACIEPREQRKRDALEMLISRNAHVHGTTSRVRKRPRTGIGRQRYDVYTCNVAITKRSTVGQITACPR